MRCCVDCKWHARCIDDVCRANPVDKMCLAGGGRGPGEERPEDDGPGGEGPDGFRADGPPDGPDDTPPDAPDADCSLRPECCDGNGAWEANLPGCGERPEGPDSERPGDRGGLDGPTDQEPSDTTLPPGEEEPPAEPSGPEGQRPGDESKEREEDQQRDSTPQATVEWVMPEDTPPAADPVESGGGNVVPPVEPFAAPGSDVPPAAATEAPPVLPPLQPGDVPLPPTDLLPPTDPFGPPGVLPGGELPPLANATLALPTAPLVPGQQPAF